MFNVIKNCLNVVLKNSVNSGLTILSEIPEENVFSIISDIDEDVYNYDLNSFNLNYKKECFKDLENSPYIDDIECLNDYFKILIYSIISNKLMRKIKSGIIKDNNVYSFYHNAVIEIKKYIDNRISCNIKYDYMLPRIESVFKNYSLDDFEKLILLFLVGQKFCSLFEKYNIPVCSISNFEITTLLTSSDEEIFEKEFYFSDKSKLFTLNLICTENIYSFEKIITIDTPLLRYIVHSDKHYECFIKNCKYIEDDIDFKDIPNSESKKEILINSLNNYTSTINIYKILESKYEQKCIIYIFEGEKNSDKLITAIAFANTINKKILYIDSLTLTITPDEEDLRFLFRIASFNNSIIFFDNFDNILEDVYCSFKLKTCFINELKRYPSTVIFNLEDISQFDNIRSSFIFTCLNFGFPNLEERYNIWELYTKKAGINLKEKDLKYLSQRYYIDNDTIKEVIYKTIETSFSTNTSISEIKKTNIIQSCDSISNDRFKDLSIHDSNVSFTDIILPNNLIEDLKTIINFKKSKATLVNEWGFAKHLSNRKGYKILFHGQSGTGKTMSANLIANELDMKLQVVNFAKLNSMWVGETGKNIESIFSNIDLDKCILLFDDADAIFSQRTTVRNSTDKYSNMDIDILLTQLENYAGFVIMTSNFIDCIDNAMFRRFDYVIEFPMPDYNTQLRLWRLLLPKQVPLGNDIDFESLCEKYSFTGANIKNIIVRACSEVALRNNSDRFLTQADLLKAAKKEHTTNNKGIIGFKT
jgi:ATP-dependent 26S proteasome regulatory subunit